MTKSPIFYSDDQAEDIITAVNRAGDGGPYEMETVPMMGQNFDYIKWVVVPVGSAMAFYTIAKILKKRRKK